VLHLSSDEELAMKVLSRLAIVLAALAAVPGTYAAQAQNSYASAKSPNELKLIKSPTEPYPTEALLKDIEGVVTVGIVVDAKGNVADAQAINGPPELFEAAVESVKHWTFQPPAHPPVLSTVEIGYGHPHECPGPKSTISYIVVMAPLRSERGVSVNERANDQMPQYYSKERLAGIAGEMVLAITISPKGRVTRINVVKPLSPRLDRAAVRAVRTWRLTLVQGNSDSLPDVFLLRINYEAMCPMQL
jgi:TonB family protein